MELNFDRSTKAGFSLIDGSQSGVRFTNSVSQDRHLTNQIYLNGSGVAAGDIDGDGWCDLYFCALDGENKLFRNLGNWRFEDVTAGAGVACSNLDCTGAAFADIDGDSDLDLIVNSIVGGTHVFFNDGKGHFKESPSVLNAGRGGMSLALGDVDGDGALDLYVANYRTVTLRDQPNTRFSMKITNGVPIVDAVDGRPLTSPDLTNRFTFEVTVEQGGGSFNPDENGEADAVYRNDGTGKFIPISFTDGSFLDEDGKPLAKPPFDWGLSVMIRDLNGDGLPDIYVCNDFKSPDRIWINKALSPLTPALSPLGEREKTARFQAADRLAFRQLCLSAMGVDVADVDRDGFDDIFVVDMLSRDHVRRQSQRIDIKPEILRPGQIDNRPQYGRNMFFHNRGDGTYAEIAQMLGLQATEWSWTPVFLDVDLDGYEDVLISNGFERDGMNVDVLRKLEQLKREKKRSNVEQLRLRTLFPILNTPNLAFRNRGDLVFEDQSAQWGFDAKGVSQGMALADLDNDGDLDVIINNFNGPAAIFRNNAPASRLAVRLKGKAPNTHGIGAKIKVFGEPVVQSQEIICGGRYLSSDNAMRAFAAGAGEMRIEVTWRSGKQSIISDAKANRLYEIDESGAVQPVSPAMPSVPPRTLFRDASQSLTVTHIDEPFDDFTLQPLLPNRLSQLGPGISWFDCDSDGWEELIMGSGRGGQLAVFRNNKGSFDRLSAAPYTQPVTRDQTTVLGWRDSSGRGALLVGSANYEDGLAAGGLVRQYDLSRQAVIDVVPATASSAGPMALADVNGDGQLDLFVGGRVISGKCPEPASSTLLQGRDSGFIADSANARTFADIGMISGAVFSDLDGDGDPDLVLACEWGPIRVFKNESGKFVEGTERLGLAKFTGWWNGVAVGDFDGDGRMDFVASNWGRNSKYQSLRNPSVHLFYGDIDGNGIVDIVEAYDDPKAHLLLPLQPLYWVGAAMPFLQEKFPTFDAYARANLEQVYGDKLKSMRKLEAASLESSLFLNRGDHFEAHALPIEAQIAPAFGVCVADFDGDGNEDVFLSQNFFATQPEISRYDAGRGLCLLGDGKGGFKPLSGQESGIRIYGEQRGAAVCDYDQDGRVDLAVGQNSAPVKLFHNEGAKAGLRVQLIGPAGNATAVGAVIRFSDGKRFGPAREIHAGSGYWSQDSAVQVLAIPDWANQLSIRWPGGKTTTSTLPKEAREVSVSGDGFLKVLGQAKK